MSMTLPPNVTTFGLFEKRFDGDNSLLDLARRRFEAAGMGAEMYADSPEHLAWLMGYRPKNAPLMVHLDRKINLAEEQSRRQIVEFATRFAGQVRGLVLHDHATMAARKDEYINATWEMDNVLEKIDGCPQLFIEYAAGLEPEDFLQFFATILDLERISPCLDIGHLGLRQARRVYAWAQRGEDIYALKAQPSRIPERLGAVETAVRAGSAAVSEVLDRMSSLRKPVHFHLHDAHPLSAVSPFGLSDHLSFLAAIPVPLEHGGQRMLAPMFGPQGLSNLVSQAVQTLGSRRVSFTLEIHPTGERLPLGEAAALFGHWTDKTNAEQMNHWLGVLCSNHQLLRQALEQAASAPAEGTPTGRDQTACVLEAS
jgi:hypothetical protein